MKSNVTLKQARADAQAKIEALHNYINAIDGMIKAGIDADTPALGKVPKTPTAKAAKDKEPKSPKAAKVKPQKVIPKGARPSMIDACKLAMAGTTIKKPMSNMDVIATLRANKWLPGSRDPEQYVRYTLSKERDIFMRVPGDRGKYYLAPGVSVPRFEGDMKVAEKEETTEEESAETTEESASEETNGVESASAEAESESEEEVEAEPEAEEVPPPAPPAPKAPPPKPAPAVTPKPAPAPVKAAPPAPISKPVSPPPAPKAAPVSKKEETPEEIAAAILAEAGIDLP